MIMIVSLNINFHMRFSNQWSRICTSVISSLVLYCFILSTASMLTYRENQSELSASSRNLFEASTGNRVVAMTDAPHLSSFNAQR